VAGAWMGLAVKTDGAAVASGAIADSLIRAKALAADGVNYKEGWIMGAATTVKVFIDVFIGVWAFILAIIWTTVIERKPGERVGGGEIWHRFPKFVIGYVITFAVILWICVPASKSATALGDQAAPIAKKVAAGETQLAALTKQLKVEQDQLTFTKKKDKATIAALKAQIEKDQAAISPLTDQLGKDRGQLADLNNQLKGPSGTMKAAKSATGAANIFRGIFFTMTFFTIGLVSNFKKLWEEGIGKLAAVYVISLFGFIIWVGLIISWIFFHGVKPPLAG
jgi:hypothetical protein